MCFVLASVAINGCAIHFADNGSALPSSTKTIYVAPFENLTYVSGVNDQFMRYMKDAISSRGRLVAVDDPKQADLLARRENSLCGDGACKPKRRIRTAELRQHDESQSH
jgi:hypothetical protein